VPIRLSGERWSHIIEHRDELAGRMDDVLNAVSHPDWVTRGKSGSIIAWKGFGRSKYLSVIYKEIGRTDGFVITAFFTTKPKKRMKIWP